MKTVPCTKCGKPARVINSSSSFSSKSFPIYDITRYKDLESKPRKIHLCEECSDALDSFLYIYTSGEDYYRDYDNEGEKQ